jgi:hypothetical protein
MIKKLLKGLRSSGRRKPIPTAKKVEGFINLMEPKAKVDEPETLEEPRVETDYQEDDAAQMATSTVSVTLESKPKPKPKPKEIIYQLALKAPSGALTKIAMKWNPNSCAYVSEPLTKSIVYTFWSLLHPSGSVTVHGDPTKSSTIPEGARVSIIDKKLKVHN